LRENWPLPLGFTPANGEDSLNLNSGLQAGPQAQFQELSPAVDIEYIVSSPNCQHKIW